MTLRSLFVAKHATDVAALVDAFPLAWIVSSGAGGHGASLLPLLAERDAAGNVEALFGHIARGNPQTALLERNPSAMVLLQGPDAYISPGLVSIPTWGPTWNYAAVRFEVEVEFVPQETEEALHRLAAWMERARAEPWSPARMGPRFAELATRVIAFRARIVATHAAFKLGQDERAETFAEIVGGVGDPALAYWMERSRQD